MNLKGLPRIASRARGNKKTNKKFSNFFHDAHFFLRHATLVTRDRFWSYRVDRMSIFLGHCNFRIVRHFVFISLLFLRCLFTRPRITCSLKVVSQPEQRNYLRCSLTRIFLLFTVGTRGVYKTSSSWQQRANIFMGLCAVTCLTLLLIKTPS